MTWRRKALVAAAAASASLAFAASASAADIVVDTTADEYLSNPLDCSLREATVSANFDNGGGWGCISGTAGSDSITFDPAIFPAGGVVEEINLTTLDNGELLLMTPMTITGPGMDQLTINAPPDDRVLEINVPATDVEITGLNIEGGDLTEDDLAVGGGIRSAGNLTLTDVRVTGNKATATGIAPTLDTEASGGGIYSSGSLELDGSVVEGNMAIAHNPTATDTDAIAQGGGIFAAGTTIRDSTIADNSATATDDLAAASLSAARTFGAGVSIASSNLSMDHSTVSGNVGTAFSPEGGTFVWGGGMRLGSGAHVIELSTIAGNQTLSVGGLASLQDGGGILGSSGTLELQSSTVAGNGPQNGTDDRANLAPSFGGTEITLENTIVSDPRGGAGSANCDGEVTSNGFNIVDDDSCGLDQGTDQEGLLADPDLTALADNGGPTKTLRPLPGSPAIDAGSAEGQSPAFADEDQRGLTRPVDSLGAANVDDGSDVGAFEVQRPATPTLIDTNPDSPSTMISNPSIIGTSDSGVPEGATQIVFYSDPGCSDELGAFDPSPFATSGVEVDLPTNATTTVYALTNTDYDTQSPCSSTLSSNGSITYTHDSVGPALTIDGGPSGSTTNRTPTFTFHATDLSPPIAYQCSLDTGTPSFSPCTSPFASASLPDGSYTFRVSAQDSLLNPASTATQGFTVTTPVNTPPVTTTPPAVTRCPKGKKLVKGKCVKKKRKKRK